MKRNNIVVSSYSIEIKKTELMIKQININCENTGIKKAYPVGTTLKEIVEDQIEESDKPILGAMVNNSLRELCYSIYKPKTVRFIDYSHPDGKRMYERSLSMVLFKAVHELFPDNKLAIKHSVSKGFYCEIEDLKLTAETHVQIVNDIRNRMAEIIADDIPFVREEVETEKALKMFEQYGLDDKCKLLKSRVQLYTSVYKLDDVIDYYYGYLVPSTAYLSKFNLVNYYDGMLLMFPKSDNIDEIEDIVLQPKLFEVYSEYKEWVEILGVPNVGQLNEINLSGNIGELIKIAEALQEKKLACIADMIGQRKDKVRVILISGPSSSGKTTFAKRLSIQLRVLGIKPILISLDNYFVNRSETPKDENGEYDFESPNALDIRLFNDNMLDLMAGKSIKLPKFSFTDGSRYYDDHELKINDDNVIVVEGIHALNPKISEFIPGENMFKVYVSALTQLSLDSHNRIPTTDNRLIRRMIRDSLYRGYSAYDTLKRWQSVRAGEEKHIFPYQEEADVMFNTALLFELGVLKNWAEPLLHEVQMNVPEYAEAKRLLKLLSYFVPIIDLEIPPTSILREFLDGSSFDYS